MELNTMQLLATEIILASVGIFLCVKCIFLKKDHMDFFLKFIVVMDLFLLINIPIRMVELQFFQFNRILVYWMYDASVVLMNLMCFYWLVFILKQLESKIVDTVFKIHILMIPALCVIPLCVVNRWSGWLYYIDESSFYHRGSIFILQGLVGYIYLFGIILSVLVGFFRAEDKKGFMKFVNSIFPEVVGIVLQIVFGGSYLIASTLYCALMMYIEICLDRQKAYELNDAVSELNDLLVHTNSRIASNMRTIIALSDIYHIMYDMNLEDDSFVEVKAPGDVSKFSKQFKSASEWIHNLPRALFYKDYIPLLEEYYDVEKDTEEYDARKITRLVPEVSYIEGPEGDIPSVEIDGWREKYSQGIQLKDRLTVSFHAKCLPHAMLVWHCPFVFLYTSEDGQVNGPGYREFDFLRFDGESWQNDSGARNSITVERTDEFKDWEQWKWGNKEGKDITLKYVREGNKIFLSTECGGLVLRNVTELTEDVDELYVALSGDLCVIENIRIGV